MAFRYFCCAVKYRHFLGDDWMAEILYQLTHYSASLCRSYIEWLGENDMGKFNEHLVLAGQKPGNMDSLKNMYKDGITRYCLLYHDGIPVARGAVEPISEYMWEAADIRTAKEFRGRGFATEILRFLSYYIIAHGKIATCRTEEDNTAMEKVIKSVGFTRMNEEDIHE